MNIYVDLLALFFSLIGLSLPILCNRICELLFIFFSAVSRRIGVFHKLAVLVALCKYNCIGEGL